MSNQNPFTHPGGPPLPGGHIIQPQRAQMAQIQVIAKGELYSKLLHCASTLDECRSKLIREVATLTTIHGTVETGAKALENVVGGGGIDPDVIAGSDDLPVLKAAIQAVTDIAERLGGESATLLATRKGP